MTPRFALVDSLRGIAAVAVVAFHVGQGLPGTAFAKVVRNFDVGVTVFFIISGFLLYRPFVLERLGVGRKVRVLDYGRRRTLRIVPAYWVALTALSVWPGLNFEGPRWVYYLFGQVYRQETALTGIAPAWTLCTEVAFYTALPLIAWLTRRMTLRVELAALAVGAATSVAFRGVLFHGFGPDFVDRHSMLSLTLLGTFGWFALGMALATLSAHERLPTVPGWICWPVAGVGYAVVLIAPDEDVFGHLMFGFIALAIVYPSVARESRSVVSRVLELRPLVWLGLVSYGIYLWHLPLVRELHVRISSGAAWALSALLASVAAGALSYYVIEAPVLRRKR